MSNPRERTQELERIVLSPKAALADESKGRIRFEEECKVRTCYQRDVDRIIHSKAFRRLKHKTQVFLQPEGDHYRTRMTHTLEVSRIARTIARALRLNEDLTEAISLGHDLGHTPFGHAGERALNDILSNEGGFKHNRQSLRVTAVLEMEGAGLNLCYETSNGIVCHTDSVIPKTLEGAVVRYSDRIAYINHDVDDAIRAGILTEESIPEEIVCALGTSSSERINNLISDIINVSQDADEIRQSPEFSFVFDSFYSFMFQSVYKNEKAKSEEKKVFGILNGIFGYYVDNPDKLPQDYKDIADKEGLNRAVCDYVSGMTDKYAIYKYNEIYIPESWHVF